MCGDEQMSMNLADRTCVPCTGGEPPLSAEQIAPLLSQIETWDVEDDSKLVKVYRFKNFAEAAAFVQEVAAIAEDQWHHPELLLRWGQVRAELQTKKIKGLSEADFILAAKLDRAYSETQRLVDKV
jgi:4a-hydroxytetrahydrobiopterin dehydratase